MVVVRLMVGEQLHLKTWLIWLFVCLSAMRGMLSLDEWWIWFRRWLTAPYLGIFEWALISYQRVCGLHLTKYQQATILWLGLKALVNVMSHIFNYSEFLQFLKCFRSTLQNSSHSCHVTHHLSSEAPGVCGNLFFKVLQCCWLGGLI